MTTRVRIWRNTRATLPPGLTTAASKAAAAAVARSRTRMGTRGPVGCDGAVPAAALASAGAAAWAAAGDAAWEEADAAAATAGAGAAFAMGSMMLGPSTL